MKVRNGFVSNSSSSSFLIYGINVEQSDDILKNNQQFLEYIKKKSNEYDLNNQDWIEDIDLLDELYEYINSLDMDDDIKIEIPYDGDTGYYIGSQWSNVRDDQTGLQFKERIKHEIKRIFPSIEDKEFSTFSAAWYN